MLPVLVAFCASCGAGETGDRAGFALPPAPEPGALVPATGSARALHARGARSGGADEWGRVEAGGETRTALLTTPGGWSWEGEVPPEAQLRLGVTAVPDAWKHADRLTVRVRVGWEKGEEVVEQVTVERSRAEEREALLDAPASGDGGGGDGGGGDGDVSPPAWRDLVVDLGRFAGRRVTLELLPTFDRLPPELRDDSVVAWSPARLGPAPGSAATARARAADPRPNVLLIVIGTLRADHLPAWGYGRDTTPEIDRRLVRRGVVFEQAEAQAPWALPSALGYVTGRHPSELLGGDPGKAPAGAVPPAVATLAERFRRLGYRTAGFLANPLLHGGNGFGRGFETFYSPGPDVPVHPLHGDAVTTRALPWMLGHAGEPFFVHLHYPDPHDPYRSPTWEDGGPTAGPGYDGPVEGDWVQGLFTGLLELPDPERDRARLVDLYDGEIRYADRQVGHVLGSLPPEVLARTLVVLTSDHGEELLDHGWWKHGQTVYREQLHVPLVMRWDDRLPAGGRVAAPVQLLDLVPTLLAAATGADVDGEHRAAALEGREAWDGIDLLPVATGRREAPRRPAVADHLASGPRRASVRLGDWKLLMFDRFQRYEPVGVPAQNLYRVALDRLSRLELYHLARDPGEEHDLAAAHPDVVKRLAPRVIRQLDAGGRFVRGRPALRVALGAVPDGARLEGEIDFDRPPAGWVSDFLAAEDRVELDGTTLRLGLRGEGWPKGLLVLPPEGGGNGDGKGGGGGTADGDDGGTPAPSPPVPTALRFRLDGQPVPAERLVVGEGSRYDGRRVDPVHLATSAWPPAVVFPAAEAGGVTAEASAPLLFVWTPNAAPPPTGEAGPADPTHRRLRALGYLP